jgi:cell division protein FtsB
MTTTAPARQRPFLTPRGAILALLLVGVLFSSVYPIRRYFSVRSSITKLINEDRALDRKQQQLTQQKALLQTDAEVERIARAELNMVRPGEVAFAIIGQSSAPPRSSATTVAPTGLFDPAQTQKPGFFSRIWSAFARAAHTIR